MKIALAQTLPFVGNISKNITNHLKFIKIAANKGVSVIIFPELSLTGYEPALAKEQAIDINDDRLDIFSTISNKEKMIIGVGLLLKNGPYINISMCLFHPFTGRQIYSKRYLHPDEEKTFTKGDKEIGILKGYKNIALSICYDASIDAHSMNAYNSGAKYYINSSAKWLHNIDKGYATLSKIAKSLKMTALMVNYVGMNDRRKCVGQSAVWNDRGEVINALNDTEEGLLIYDLKTEKTETFYFSS